ncbi:MAG TPA: bifunctional UDP-N-acetylglucosamine diphosphorylase/glucosamine-1-phosphate N-acetyltransferase GlmU [Myxococcota bacterium]|nr:bifunctional UDP-N-acetylglucosamine diphosphorylase/glucosamine-1-phosphate N-acetyltransferase GlmU [Myxococcota bacterium]
MKTACVILAAGDGKRMRSALPKVMHPVCGQPMIYYPVAQVLRCGFGPVVVVVSGRDSETTDFLRGRFGNKLVFATQKKQLGTGHAVLSARRALSSHKGKLAIIYGDVPLLSSSDLSALSRAGKRAAVTFLSCRLDDPAGYGRVIRDARGEVECIVEHRDASAGQRRIDEINAGSYLVDTPLVFEALSRIKNANNQGEYYLTDLVAEARRRGLPVRAVVRPGARALLGVNDRLQLAAAERQMNLRFCERLMKKGVTIIAPEHTWLGPEVEIGSDTVLEPGCFLRGRVKIGQGCRIGPGAVITDASIGADVNVLAYSVLADCRVDRGARVGPFARLRPGAHLMDGARVGNFVEVKKSTLGKGAKAGHLSYLGDAEIGADVNVGAGTITCNYDGAHKYRTEIGEGAFIGSDTQLVAPVKVGKRAVVGAGTTVTIDVPDDALAVSRVRQKNIKGYAKRRRS